MKLYVENVGKIEKADIELRDVTVITGYNGTGKSSVCKALYGILDAYSDLNRKILIERRSSMASAVYKWQRQLYYLNDFEEIDDAVEDIIDVIGNVKQIEQGDFSLERLNKLIKERQLDIPEDKVKQLAEDLSEIIKRDKGEYVLFIVSQRIRSIFENQIGHVNYKRPSVMELNENGRVLRAKVSEHLPADTVSDEIGRAHV